MGQATQFSQYRQIVSDLARQLLGDATGPTTQASTDLAIPAARGLLGMETDPTQLAEAMKQFATHDNAQAVFADAAGSRRPIYRPLALHIVLAAFARECERLPLAVWTACEDALPEAIEPSRQVENFADAPPPPDQTDLALWHALCIYEYAQLTKRDVDLELVEGVVHATIARQGEDGALHPRDPDESLDAWSYRELVGIHALANLALLSRNQTWAQRVQAIATYHVENTQPDNFTNQPWGIFAFAWSSKTAGFAEQQMHDAATQRSRDGVTALLLADAAHSLAAFE